MLRETDLDLAVKLGLLDETTRQKMQSVDQSDDCNCSADSSAEKEIYKLKDVIICLTKEILKKEETIEKQRSDFNELLTARNQLSEYLHQAKSDVQMLEKIVDKLNK